LHWGQRALPSANSHSSRALGGGSDSSQAGPERPVLAAALGITDGIQPDPVCVTSRFRVRVLSFLGNGSNAPGSCAGPKPLPHPILRCLVPDATGVAPDVHDQKTCPSTREANATQAISTEEAAPTARAETRLQRPIQVSDLPHASASGREVRPPATSRPPAFLLHERARSRGDGRAGGTGRRRTSVAARGPCDVACVWRP